MVRCECGADSTAYALAVDTIGPCLFDGCERGYKKCAQCTWAGKTLLKCCSSNECGGKGKRKCKNCGGTATVTTKMKCQKTHRAAPLGGRS
jgi:hypothetical protein